jgi:hypothetical protein
MTAVKGALLGFTRETSHKEHKEGKKVLLFAQHLNFQVLECLSSLRKKFNFISTTLMLFTTLHPI